MNRRRVLMATAGAIAGSLAGCLETGGREPDVDRVVRSWQPKNTWTFAAKEGEVFDIHVIGDGGRTDVIISHPNRGFLANWLLFTGQSRPFFVPEDGEYTFEFEVEGRVRVQIFHYEAGEYTPQRTPPDS